MKPITRYTHLGFWLNSLLDQGEVLNYEETVKHIEDGTLFKWLQVRFIGKIDLSLYHDAEGSDMLELFRSLSNAVDAKRKMGVEKNGLSLLVAYCFEGIQELT